MPALPPLLRLHALFALGTLFCPAAAVGQSVDYQALQEIIGEPVTTSVTGKPQRASELPASAVIISRADIARSPARDVPGLLKAYAGIDVNRWTAGQSDVAVRGGVQTYNARLLVLVDGRQVYLDHYGMTNWNLLGVQLEEIQQIELVRGPASALFGFNAAGGVVNIITRRNVQAASATASAEYGTHDLSRVAAAVMLPVTGTIGAKMSAGRAREDERHVPSTLLAPSSIFDVASDQLAGEVLGTFGVTQATFGAGHATNRQIEYLPSQILSNQRYRKDNVHGLLTRDTPWGGLSVAGHVDWLTADYSALTGPFASASTKLRNRVAIGKMSTLVRIDSVNTLRLGAEYRQNQLRSALQYSRRLSYDVASADMMIDLRPVDRVSLTAAGRLDRLWLRQSGAIIQPSIDDPAAFQRAFSRFSFNAGLLVRIGTADQLRLNGGRGYQLPSITSLGVRLPIAAQLPFPVLILGQPRANPVTVWSGELGYVHQAGRVRTEVTSFVTRTENAIATPGDGFVPQLFFTPAPVLVDRFRDVGNYSTYGVEASAAGRLSVLDWRANYTWTHTDEQLTPLTFPIAYVLSPKSTTPRHKANLSLGYAQGPLQLTTLLRYTSATRQFAFVQPMQIRLLPVDAAVAADARVGYRLTPALELFAAGENLTLARGAAVSPIPADRRMRAGVRLAL
jgi:iron complex outermembrane receptor protein